MNGLITTPAHHPIPSAAQQLLSRLERHAVGTLKLTTPTGKEIDIGDGKAPFADIRVNDWRALGRIFRSGDIGLGECYRDGMIETSSIVNLIHYGLRNKEKLSAVLQGNPLMRIAYLLQHFLRSNTRSGSRKNIEAHYDLGNNFYELWLDSSMTYSSGLFQEGFQESLEEAQAAKYQRMLDLIGAKQGDRVLEIGCGWGGFAEHAAKQGIHVHGVTLSPSQLRYAKARIDRAGLSDKVDLELRDYRDIQGSYDHIVSIEMLEAVGERFWDTYFSTLHSLLKPGGKASIQVITIDDDHFEDYRKRADFIQRYIFPGGMLPCQSRLKSLVRSHKLTELDYMCFGRDYAETLRRWRNSFEQSLAPIMKQGFDRAFIRLWRFYLCYCEAGFDDGRINVVHLAVEKPHEH